MNRRLARTRLSLTTAAGAFLALALAVPLAQAAPPVAATVAAAVPADALAISEDGPEAFTEEVTGLPDIDTRGRVLPTAAQRSAVPSGVTVRWNRYGTPASVHNPTGYLSGPRSGAAPSVARTWLSSQRAAFGLTAAQVQSLQVLTDSPLTQSRARVVRFRQLLGTATPALDGMVTVTLDPSGRVTYASSSLSRVSSAAPAASLTPLAAWSAAVADLRADDAPSVPAADLAGIVPVTVDGWTSFRVPGFAQVQQVRLRALALPGAAVRPVFETNVVNAAGGTAAAYTSFVDAISGDVLVRRNRTDNLSTVPKTVPTAVPMTTTTQVFQGSYTAAACGTATPTFPVDAATRTIVVTAAAAVTTDDVVVKLLRDGTVVASGDTATSPEALTYAPAGGVPAGTYTVQVCPFDDPMAPIVGGPFAGTFVASETDTPAPPSSYPPKWKYFLSNPSLDFSPSTTTDTRKVDCWENVGVCDVPPSPRQNLAARGPYDVSFRTNLATNTTTGNAANTAEAWVSPLTPGGAQQRPVSANRHYGFDNPGQDFTDAWNNTGCSPAALTPANNNNDVLAAVTNLFAGHNRFHDYSYFLGFTETNYNLQDVNFGNTPQGGTIPGGEGDPEIGNAQAGAITGGAPSYLGRDNANQITLQDGIPGITNQYLFQPIAAAFYSPCVDGDYDAPVYGHEYTHAISNRMVAGPDDGLSGLQAGSMGESWSDQVALEYLFEHSYPIGAASPWVEGPYVTGNTKTGIRNYALDANPLQYGALGYDVTGAEVHADGEIWSAAMFNVRRKLVAKYNGTYAETNKSLQLRCATAKTPAAPLPPEQCPGGRRWVQLMFDSFLMQESATTMLDARDAFLGADLARFGGANATAIWSGFAEYGMGSNASTTSTDDEDPKSGYVSPRSSEGTLSLKVLGFDGSGQVPVKGKVYVGDYEARATPIADTDPATSLPSTISMVPGSYRFVFAAPGYGLKRFTATVTAGSTNSQVLHLSRNLASSTNGATVDGASAGSLNAGSLLDDTEATNWAGVNAAGVSVDTSEATHPLVNVDLAGGAGVVRAVRVSSLLRPASDTDSDPDAGARFTALRQFAIETCTESTASDCSSTLPSTAVGSPYRRIYTSPANAFDGVRPRPLAPALLMKGFDVPDTSASHVRLVALENQCTGQAQFAGEQDSDPLNDTDCKAASTADESVRAAELEVFGFDGETRPPGDPVVVMTMTAPPTAGPGDTVRYTLSYRNLGPAASSAADIRITRLPAQLAFVSASNGGTYASTSRALRWTLGTVPAGATGTRTLTTRVGAGATLGDTILNQAQFAGKLTLSPPAAAVTLVTP